LGEFWVGLLVDLLVGVLVELLVGLLVELLVAYPPHQPDQNK
jgi:hypothetical protein